MRRGVVKKPIAAFADDSESEEDRGANASASVGRSIQPAVARKPWEKSPVLDAFKQGRVLEDTHQGEEETVSSDSVSEAGGRLSEDEENDRDVRAKPRLLRQGGVLRGFVPAGFDRAKELEERQRRMEERQAHVEQAAQTSSLEQGEKEEDELDMFMRNVHRRELHEQSTSGTTTDGAGRAVRADIEGDAEEERETKALEALQRRNAQLRASGLLREDGSYGEANGEEDAEYDEQELLDAATGKRGTRPVIGGGSSNHPGAAVVDYDSDGNPIYAAMERRKDIDPLPPIDHSTIEYPDVEFWHYEEHADIAGMSEEQCVQLRKSLGIRVSGLELLRPCTAFAHFGFPERLMNAIARHGYTEPTAIQKQAVPCALAGRDLIAIAKTGSGKTAAFLWPMLVHALDQPAIGKGDGPIGLVLAPTQELVHQIYVEAKSFAKPLGLNVGELYGGANKGDQFKMLRSTLPAIIIATPGRLIDLVKMKGTNLERVTFLVLDEADRMFDMGFEAQVKSICNHVRPERQTLLFSATFRPKVESLAREVLVDPIRILVGSADGGDAATSVQGFMGTSGQHLSVNPNIEQHVVVVPTTMEKWSWMCEHVKPILDAHPRGSLLVFVSRKEGVEQLAANLASITGIPCLSLHGDLLPVERQKVMQTFKKPLIGESSARILVATDIASRGLDISHLQVVINYDLPKDMEAYLHRIGRTGRSGQQLEHQHGTAYTLVTQNEPWFARKFIQLMEHAVPQKASTWITKELKTLAVSSKNGGVVNTKRRTHGFAPPATLYAPPKTLVSAPTSGSSESTSAGERANVPPPAMTTGWQHQMNPEYLESLKRKRDKES